MCDKARSNLLRRLLKPDRRKPSPPQRPASLIVGLGNPGAKYLHTRHNIGFMVIDKLGSSIDSSSKERFQGAILESRSDDETLVLLKPLTFMNDSGTSVSQVARWYKIPPEKILIICDDLDLPFGTIRLRPKGSAGGHNGLASVIRHLGTDEVHRLRIGIGRPVSGSTVNYVLSRFSKEEQTELTNAINTASEVAGCWLRDGVQTAMNRYN
jgi:peptidyl-tRNA hydrolase, PTH1 family